MNRINIIPEKRSNRFILLTILLMILSIESIWVFNPQMLGITGFATYDGTESLVLNKTYYNNSEELLDINSQIIFLSMNARLIGDGNATVWIEYNNTRVLVARLQSKDKEIGNNLITGLVIEESIIENITEEINTTGNETGEPAIVEPLSEQEINITQENITQENTTEILQEINTTQENTTETLQEINTTQENTTEINITQENTTEINITQENTTEITTEINVTEENITEEASTTFNDVCVDSCVIEGMPPYKLVIELSGATLYIDSINYKTKLEPIIQIMLIPNMTLDKNNNLSVLNLSEYFNSTQELSYDISSVDTQILDISIEGELLQISLLNNTVSQDIDAYIYATDGENLITSNTFTIHVINIEVNSTNVTIDTIQYSARINEKVKWVKKITSLGEESEINVTIPTIADNITITKTSKDKAYTREEYNNNKLDKEDNLKEKSQANEKKSKNSRELRIAMENEVPQDSVETESIIPITINDTIENVEIAYYTEAPIATEITINENVKEVIVSSGTHYTNVLSYADLPSEIGEDKWVRLVWVINNTQNITDLNLTAEEMEELNISGFIKKDVLFTSYDTDNNGLIDHIEWVAPHLSEQKFIIIVITKADLLDENRNFIESIYEYVKDKNDVWFNVSENNYVRVTFEKKLTSSNDITIYARAQSEDAKIEVYEEGQNETIAEFTHLTEEKYYKVYLNNMNNSQDTFDLQIIGGTIEIDHVIDPSVTYTWNMTLITTYQDNAPANSIDGARGIQYDSRGYLIISSTTDDSFTILNISNPNNITVIGSINDAAPPGSVDNIWFGTLDDVNKLFYAPSFTDDTLSIYNVSLANPVFLNGSAAAVSVNPGSLDQVYDVAYVDIGTDRYALASASVDDTLSVYNVTNPRIVPTVLYNRTATANPCSLDEIRKLYVIPGTTLVLAAATTSDTLSVLNVSNSGVLSCVTNITNSAPPNSIDGLQDFYYEESTKLVYAPSPVDSALTILNLTNPSSISFVGTITNTTDLINVVSVAIANIGSEKYAFLGSTAIGQGIRIVNVTNPSSPTYYGLFNTTSGTCIYNQTYSLYVKDNYLFATSSGDSCFYSIKLYDVVGVPIMVSSRIYPSYPNITSTLEGYCNATDDDNIYYNYAWYLDGVINTTDITSQNFTPNTEINVANISSSQLALGQNWTLSCQANDTLSASSWFNSSTVKIVEPPIMNSSRIYPPSPNTTSVLIGYCNATDNENDNVSYNYIWYLNGDINATGITTNNYTSSTEINVANISSSYLLTGYPFVTGQNWTLSCQANDDVSSSEWLNSTTVTIVHNSGPIQIMNITLLTYYQDNNPPDSIEGARGMQFDYDRNLVIVSSTTDDSFTILNISNSTNITVFGSRSDATPPGSVDNIWFGTLDSINKIFYAPGRNDDTFSIYNVSSSSTVELNSSAVATANPSSLDGVYDVAYVDVGADRYAIASAAVNDTLSVYNITNPYIVPIALFNETNDANPCTTDDLRKLYVIPGTTLVIGASTTDDGVSIFNISEGGIISCVTQYNDSAPPNSIDGVQDFYYEESTKLLYVPGSVDSTFTILDLTNPSSISVVGSIVNTTNLTNVVSVTVASIGDNKFAFLGSTAAGKGIAIVDVTNPATPTIYGLFNQTSGTCVYNAVYSLGIVGNMLYATSGVDACFYSIKLYDIIGIPSMVTARITPLNPNVTSTLQGYCNATDDDNIYYNYAWYLNGIINTTGITAENFTSGMEINVANISSSQLSGDQNWTFGCQANDSISISTWMNSTTVVLENNLPTLLVSSMSAQDPIEGSSKMIRFNFTVNDLDGNSTINISSARVIVNYSTIIRQSNGCTATAINATAQNVSCNVSMQYYDPFGIWSVNISINDNDNNYVENSTTSFTYNELSAIQISNNSINIGAVNVAQQHIGLTPIIINNTGNSIFVNLSIKAINLVNSTFTIPASNFTINVTNASTGQSLINNTFINITNSGLQRNNDTTIYNKTLYIYLDVPSAPLVAGYYKSTSEWLILANK